MTESLPRHWVVARLADIAEVRLGRQRSPDRAVGKHMRPYMRAANVTWGGINCDDVKEMDFTPDEQTTYTLRSGDILLAEASGSASEVGKPAVWRNQVSGACFQNTLIRVRADAELVPFLLLHFVKDAVTGAFAKASRGVGIHHLGAEAMTNWSVAVPPPNEQKKLVEAVDSHFSRLDAAVASLERVQRNLKRYRASVLQAAVEGRLVPTEAELAKKEGRNYESASKLLERILVERRKQWIEREAEKQVAKIEARRERACREKHICVDPIDRDVLLTRAREEVAKKYKEPETTDTTSLPELPEGWCWTRINTIGRIQLGRQRSPAHHTGKHMRPYLRVANVFEDRIDTSDIMWMNFTPDEFATYQLKPGDILLNEGQSPHLIGRPAMYRNEVPGACFTNSLIRFQASPAVDPRFALVVFLAQLNSRRYMRVAQITTNIAHLSAGRFAEIEFPLPPLHEQGRIADEIERQSSTMLAVQASLDANAARLARLRQSVLNWAFSGNLVDQDPNDEPASVLLARIKAERAAAEKPKKNTPRPRKQKATKVEEQAQSITPKSAAAGGVR